MFSITDAADLPRGGVATRLGAPTTIALLVCLLAAGLASLPLSLPIGPMYWDLVVYFDGSQRVLAGQVPSVDFFAPVGALGYWLFAGARTLFPHAQPLLLAQWMLLVVTLPPLLPVLRGIDRTSRGRSLAVLLPFLVFQMLPMNVEQYSTYPSVDGYGLYNREVTEVLYVLMAALVFEKRKRVLAFSLAWCMTALFFLKITGFVSGGLLCAFAFAAGRVSFASALVALAAFMLALAGLELSLGLVSAYVGDILKLVTMNEGVLASRFLQAASIHFGIFGTGICLLAGVATVGWRSAASDARAFRAHPNLRGFARLLDRDMAWLAAALFTGLFFETQNTGGQAFIFLWPLLLHIASCAIAPDARRAVLVLTLVAATALPPLVSVVHRFARAVVGQMQYVALPQTHLRALGAVTQRREIIERAAFMNRTYAAYPEVYDHFAENEDLPVFALYSELDFQASWLLGIDEAAGAILAYEAEHRVRFETIMSLNFVNPFPYLLDREAPKRIAIGADPSRAVPPADAATIGAVRGADLVLYPTCPVTSANRDLRRIYAAGLAGHREVRLSPCWIGYVRDGLGGAG